MENMQKWNKLQFIFAGTVLALALIGQVIDNNIHKVLWSVTAVIWIFCFIKWYIAYRKVI
jgi:hypothetical protein